MGRTFRYVADDSLEAHRLRHVPCPLCGSEDDVYPVFAEPAGGCITEACLRCIRSLPLDAIMPWRSERRAADYLRGVAPDVLAADREARRAEMCAELRRTPRVPPFAQDDDWPLCCGDFTEYVGRPVLPDKWDDLGGLSLFRCPTCGNGIEVFQHT